MAAGELTINISKEDLQRLNGILYGFSKMEKSVIIDKGLKDATAVLMAEGKRNLKQSYKTSPWNKRTGRLERSFTNRINRKTVAGYAGFKRPEGSHAHLVDSGTVDRWTKSGAYRGKVKPTRFWKNAVDSKANKAIETLLESVQNTLVKIVETEGKVS